MKFIGNFVLLFGFFVNAKCIHFEIHSKTFGGACIMLDMDAEFDLTYKNNRETQKAPLFNLTGATADTDSSKCGNELIGTTSVLSARMFPTRELLTFTFERQNGNVVMSVRFTLDAKKHFKHMNDTIPVELNDEKHLQLGPDTPNSYLCLTEETVKFSRTNNFMMTMKITKLHAQAYRITRSTFGPVVECSQDFATSTSQPETTVVPHNQTTPSQPETTVTVVPQNETTPSQPETTVTVVPQNETTPSQPETTVVPHNETSPSQPETTVTVVPQNETTPSQPETTVVPQNETTPSQPETTTAQAMETTTTMTPTTPETHGSKYVVRDNEEVCIVLQGTITFEIPFQKKDGSTGTATVAIPDSVNVNGNCSYSNTAQEITLTFFNTQWVLDIVVAKETKISLQNSALFKSLSSGTSDYSWQAVSLTYVIDSHFPNAKNQGMKVKAAAAGTFGKFKANTDGSYKCNAEQDLEFGKDRKMKMDLSKMQYRAFGTTNSTDFSNTDVFDCPADNHDNDKGKSHKTLGIALGCAFAGLVVIVVVACGITRYRRRQKVEGPYDAIN